MDNKIYWMNKEERAKLAVEKTNEREVKFGEEIAYSHDNGGVLNRVKPFNIDISELECPCMIIVSNTDAVSAVYDFNDYTKYECVLNFASFLNPGGKFIEGSSAQEESLCMESTLYNVLTRFDEYYKARIGRSNNCLYENEAIYTPDIIFDRDGINIKCDVLTCAAVNKSASKRFHGTSDEVIDSMMASRLEFVLLVAASMGVKTLILGAFGCGVFGNDPKDVAKQFYYLLRDVDGPRYDRLFDTVVFAIPTMKEGDKTFEIFRDIFFEEEC